MQAAVRAGQDERAASLRDQEKELLAEKASRQQEWAAAHPDLPSLAEKVRQLSDEIGQPRRLGRQQPVRGKNRHLPGGRGWNGDHGKQILHRGDKPLAAARSSYE